MSNNTTPRTPVAAPLETAVGKQVYLMDHITTLLATHRIVGQDAAGAADAGYFTPAEIQAFMDPHFTAVIETYGIWFNTETSFDGNGLTEATAYSIKDGAINNAKIAAAAAIALSKINFAAAVVDDTALKLLALDGSGVVKFRTVGSLPAGSGGGGLIDSPLRGVITGGAESFDIDLSALPATTINVKVYFNIIFDTAYNMFFRVQRKGVGSFDSAANSYYTASNVEANAELDNGKLAINCNRVNGFLEIIFPMDAAAKLIINGVTTGIQPFGTGSATQPHVSSTVVQQVGALDKIQLRCSGTGFGSTVDISGGNWFAQITKSA